MRALTLKVLPFALLLGATAAHAGWQDHASQGDTQRLSRIDESRQKAMSEAAAGPHMGTIRAVVDAQGSAPSGGELVGSWRCRTIKLGGITPSVVYGWFNCRISNRGGGLYLQKTSGSQRTNGYLYPGDGGMVYLGASSVTGEPAHAYSGGGASAGADATPDDQIGLLTMIGAGHARLEMPFPVQESTMDVLELKR
ncbi:MAG TPA: DUF4893 domain-containing protein [Rhizomicrobium sp.]|jgi:hypothetical protein|nr:DUF4893 domain-containing protein [Rhizomicrobium sp.]